MKFLCRIVKQRAILLVSHTFCLPALVIGVGISSGRSTLSRATVVAFELLPWASHLANLVLPDDSYQVLATK